MTGFLLGLAVLLGSAAACHLLLRAAWHVAHPTWYQCPHCHSCYTIVGPRHPVPPAEANLVPNTCPDCHHEHD